MRYLVAVVLLEVFGADSKHLLNLHHVATAQEKHKTVNTKLWI
jgi:hypothetical protein